MVLGGGQISVTREGARYQRWILRGDGDIRIWADSSNGDQLFRVWLVANRKEALEIALELCPEIELLMNSVDAWIDAPRENDRGEENALCDAISVLSGILSSPESGVPAPDQRPTESSAGVEEVTAQARPTGVEPTKGPAGTAQGA